MHSTPSDSNRTAVSRRHALQLIGVSAFSMLSVRAHGAEKALNDLSMLEAINQAGRQRMLSQRTAKLYAQLIKGVRPDQAHFLLTASMSLFEKQLDNLRTFAQNHNATQIVQTYAQLGERWSSYKQIVAAEPTMEGLKVIANLNEQVLATAHEATVQLEKLHGGSLGRLVNIAGRQRMLSQRISKFYFFRRCGLTAPEIDKGMEAARIEFTAAQKTLKAAPENTQTLLSWLTIGDSQWLFFDDAVRANNDKGDEAEYHNNNVAVTSENILQVMDKVAGLYAGLGAA